MNLYVQNEAGDGSSLSKGKKKNQNTCLNQLKVHKLSCCILFVEINYARVFVPNYFGHCLAVTNRFLFIILKRRQEVSVPGQEIVPRIIK